MKIVVLDAATLGADLDLSPLQEFGEVVIRQNTAPEEVADALADADAAVLNKIRLNESNLARCVKLKIVCIAATGYDNVDTAYCRSRRIAVCNVVGYSTASVAQVTVSAVLYLANHMASFTRAVRDGRYSRGKTANILTPVYHELDGKVWGIAGYGNIGRRVADAARALGCRVIVYKRTPDPSVDCVDIDTLCRESDVLTVHLPLSAETRGLFSAERVAMLKKNCIFVNAARGAVTDEAALAEAVRSRRIAGLGADVYSAEPMREDHPFYAVREMDTVCLTPHMAWGAYEARVRCLGEIVLNLRAFLKGEARCRVDLNLR